MDDIKTLREARELKMPNQMRNIFAWICMNNYPADASEIWNKFKADMMADFRGRGHDNRTSENFTLHNLNAIFMENGMSCHMFGLPEPEGQPPVNDNQNVPAMPDHKLNAEQLEVFKFVNDTIERVMENPNGMGAGIYIDAPGGTGKTFLFNKLYSSLRDRDIKTSCAAYTGTAATLLPGGRTLHSLFKLTETSDRNFVCEVPPNSDHENLLKDTKVFMFDGSSMISRHILEAINQYLCGITENDHLFGGKILLLFGDFRQLLPIGQEDIIKESDLWQHFHKKRLTKKIRVDPNEVEFSDWLLKLGNGELSSELDDVPSDSIDIPPNCVTNDSLVEEIFGNCSEEEMIKRVILSPTNEACAKINEEVLESVPGETRMYETEESNPRDNEEEAPRYRMEYPNNMPPNCLNLKKGAIVMLLRNLSINQGLCKGIRMKVLSLHDYCVKALLLTGSHEGSEVLIPKIKLEELNTNTKKRKQRKQKKQFPLKLAYSMTIHLAQGQTFDKVGLYLPEPVFKHGQLYVAFSTVRSFKNIKVKIDQQDNKQGIKYGFTYTKNIVNRELLE